MTSQSRCLEGDFRILASIWTSHRWFLSGNAIWAMRPRTLVAQRYRAEVDHPPECFSAVGAHRIGSQEFCIMVKHFWDKPFWTFMQHQLAIPVSNSSATAGTCRVSSFCIFPGTVMMRSVLPFHLVLGTLSRNFVFQNLLRNLVSGEVSIAHRITLVIRCRS